MKVSAFELIYTLENSLKNPESPIPGIENAKFERQAHFNDKNANLTIYHQAGSSEKSNIIGTIAVKTIPQSEHGTAHECIVHVPSLKLNKKHFFLITDKLSRHLSIEKLKSSISPGIMATCDPVSA